MNKDDTSQGSFRRQREKQSPEDCQKMRNGPETTNNLDEKADRPNQEQEN